MSRLSTHGRNVKIELEFWKRIRNNNDDNDDDGDDDDDDVIMMMTRSTRQLHPSGNLQLANNLCRLSLFNSPDAHFVMMIMILLEVRTKSQFLIENHQTLTFQQTQKQ